MLWAHCIQRASAMLDGTLGTTSGLAIFVRRQAGGLRRCLVCPDSLCSKGLLSNSPCTLRSPCAAAGTCRD